MVVGCRMETLPKEIANMAQANKNKIADVGRKQDVVWWVLVDVTWHFLAVGVLGHHAIRLVGAVTKLCVDGVKGLLRGWWLGWEGQATGIVLLIVFVQDGVL
jgi:hypothetical protein